MANREAAAKDATCEKRDYKKILNQFHIGKEEEEERVELL